MNDSEQTLYSEVLIKLFRGVMCRDEHPKLWQGLIKHQPDVIDYVKVIGLQLYLMEDEGLAWLGQCKEDNQINLPSLVSKRKLSYPVSLLLALLRRLLAEHDASSGDPRLIIDKNDLAEQFKIYLPPKTNEARFIEKFDGYLSKIADLGFIRALKGEAGKWEVLRLLKAFVDAQWLNEFDQRLESYYEHAQQLSEESDE